MGVCKGESIPYIGDLFFTSTHPVFDSDALNAMEVTSRTYSFYYPDTRPGSDRYSIVCSTNANYEDWMKLSEEDYKRAKASPCTWARRSRTWSRIIAAPSSCSSL